MSGVGRGKTRYLVELQKELRNTATVLCVAITFNGPWTSVPLTTDGKHLSSEQVNMKYAINIVSRIISMHYHIPYHMAYTKLISHWVLSISTGLQYTRNLANW